MVTTIVLPISRKDFLARIFAQLETMPCDATQTNLLCYVDGDQQLYQDARNFVVNSKFNEKLCVYRRKGLPNINHISSRRRRIGEIHNEIKEIINSGDYVFLIEDDTLMPLDTLQKLLHHYLQLPYAGLITGVQIGRWGFTVPGIWKSDNPYDVKSIGAMLPSQAQSLEEIDAAGLFCCLTKVATYKKFKFEPFDTILGPDVSYGLYLRREGFKNYVDWSINTTHLTKHGEIKVANTQLQKITFTKIGEGQWQQEVV